MNDVLARIPGSALRGTLLALFGVALLLWRRPTPAGVVLLFGLVLVAWGVGAILLSLADRERRLTLAEGVAGVSAGLFVLIWPQPGSAALVALLAVWGMLGAASQVLRPEVRAAPVPLLLYGVSIGVGISLLVMGPGAFVYAWFVGAYALFVGGLQLYFALRGRRDPIPAPPPPGR